MFCFTQKYNIIKLKKQKHFVFIHKYVNIIKYVNLLSLESNNKNINYF